ncbi:MAG: FecR domain-containing protein [Spirochaetes bacterium]|jgi:hypothetical protein|nr:FecR domain-containing protein [Spirochaetota bacterium]
MKKFSVLLTVILLAITFSCTKAKVSEYAAVSFMIGSVTKNGAPVQIGTTISEKDVIETGSESFCDVTIGESIIRIKQKSKLNFTVLLKKDGSEKTALALNVGKMLCKPKKLMKEDRFTVKTSTAVAAVRGTQFTVESDPASTTRIKVFDGKVQVARNVKSLEGKIDKILESAPPVEKQEKVIVTQKDVIKAEKKVDKLLRSGNIKTEDEIVAAVLDKAKFDVVIGEKEIMKFAIGDFEKDSNEMIDVKEKPRDVIKKIAKMIEEEKEEPRPDGRILITRFELYYIKDGRVEWEGKVITEPVEINDRIYIASGEYVFCASKDGPVIWKKEIENDGKFEVRENRMTVYSGESKTTFDLETGKEI